MIIIILTIYFPIVSKVLLTPSQPTNLKQHVTGELFISAHSAWPSFMDRRIEYWRWLGHRWGGNGEFCVAVGTVSTTVGHAGLHCG